MAAASLLVMSAVAGAAPASALSPEPIGSPGWVGTAQDPARVENAIDAHRGKLAREFDERLQYVQADGRLRVMVATTSRSAAVRDFVARTTSSALWYPGVESFLGAVTPDELAALLAAPEVVFVTPDYPISYSLSTSAADVRARSQSGAPSVLANGSEEGTVSLASPALSWTGVAPGNGVNIANILTSGAGLRPVCAEGVCDTFRLHVTDQGDLRVAVSSGTRLVAVEIEKPDGSTVMSHGDSNTGTVLTLDKAEPGDYVVRTWINVLGTGTTYNATATLGAPDATGPDGVWGFDANAGDLGALTSADPYLDSDGATGRDVTVAIIDSGIDNTHVDFSGGDCTPQPYTPCNSRIKQALTISQIAGASVPELGGDLPTTEAASGHGTHVAGTIAGNGYMARSGAGGETVSGSVMSRPGIPIGIAPQASLVSIKNGDTASAGLSSYGLAWLAQNAKTYGVRVVNNSWGCLTGCSYAPNGTEAQVQKRLYEAGVLVTFAAGNGGTGSTDGQAFAGNSQSPYVLSVANYDAATHRIASSSSRGHSQAASPDPATWDPADEDNPTKNPQRSYRRPDLAAPGTDIWATRTLTGGYASGAPRVDSGDATAGAGEGTGGYVRMSGTSMAAPHVSGAAALLFSACPQARVLDVMRALMASAEATKLATTDGTRTALPFEQGYGAMDVRAGLDWLRDNVDACSVNTPPTATISAPDEVTEGAAVTFDGSGSTDADGPIASYRWDFGDGRTAEGAVVQHAYAQPGSYTVTLAVTDGDGATASTTKTVTAMAAPDPDPGTPTIQSGESVADTSQSRDQWRYYKVKVPAGKGGLEVVLDGEDCAKDRCKPNLDLYVRSAERPTLDAFECKSAQPGADETCRVANPAAGYWYVGVATAAGKEGGPFNLTATVRDATAEPDPNAAPVAAFTATCLNFECTFGDASTDSDGSIVSRAWDFGDGATSTAAAPTHAYAGPGTYAVRLTVTDDDGATATTTQTVTVDRSADPDPSTRTLQDGVTWTDRSRPVGQWASYKVLASEGATQLVVELAGQQNCLAVVLCSPDLDLYVRRGQKPINQTGVSGQCGPETPGIDETCTITAPGDDWFYVGVYTYSDSPLGTGVEPQQVEYGVTATSS